MPPSPWRPLSGTPATAEVAALLEKCAPQLVAYLSERVHGFSVSVNVKRDDKLKG